MYAVQWNHPIVQFELDKTDDIMCLLPVLIICYTQCILHVVSEQSISESLCQMSCSSSVLFPLSPFRAMQLQRWSAKLVRAALGIQVGCHVSISC